MCSSDAERVYPPAAELQLQHCTANGQPVRAGGHTGATSFLLPVCRTIDRCCMSVASSCMCHCHCRSQFSTCWKLCNSVVSQGAQGSSQGRGAAPGSRLASQTGFQGGSLTVRRRLSKCASEFDCFLFIQCSTQLRWHSNRLVCCHRRSDSQRAGILANMRRREAAFGASALARHRKVDIICCHIFSRAYLHDIQSRIRHLSTAQAFVPRCR